MIATTALQLVFVHLPSLLPAIGYTTTLLLYALAFAFLYHYLPDRRVEWRQAFLGGAMCIGGVLIGRRKVAGRRSVPDVEELAAAPSQG